jgi:integrase
MTNVAKRPNGRWRARYRDDAGKEHARHFARKVDAQRWLDSVTTALGTGSYVDPARSKVTVAVWAQQWLAGQVHLKASTRVRYEGLLRNHVLPRWGSVPVTKIGHADIATWVAELVASGLSGSSVRHAHRVLSLMLSLAVRDGRLARNPATGVKLPRATVSHKRFLTHKQVAELAQAAGDYGLAVRVLAYCGLRTGELAALRVSRVDLVRRRLDIVEAVTEVAGRAVFGTPKTHQCRSVPIPRGIADDLAAHMAGRAPDAFLFPAPRGGVLLMRNWRRVIFDPAAQEAGLAGLTPHELRHSAASLAVSAGASPLAVQRMLGHASAAMTMDVYSGLFDTDLDAVAERLDAASADSRADSLRTEASVTSITQRESTA